MKGSTNERPFDLYDAILPYEQTRCWLSRLPPAIQGVPYYLAAGVVVSISQATVIVSIVPGVSLVAKVAPAAFVGGITIEIDRSGFRDELR